MTSRNKCGFTCLGLLVLTSIVSAARSLPSSVALPDAPSADTSAPDHHREGFAKSNTDNVVGARSMFFPDLATSKRPLTVGEKFDLSAENTISLSAFIGSGLGAGINQATNTPGGYGQGAEGYAKRFGSSMATRASKNFFGTFVISSIAHQDPRYFVLQNATFAQRMNHVISRFVFARSDKGGYGFNWGGVFGPLVAEVVANSYLPVREQTGAKTLQRYGINLAGGVGLTVVKELWPTIFKKFQVK
jgi:hypothetical protein